MFNNLEIWEPTLDQFMQFLDFYNKFEPICKKSEILEYGVCPVPLENKVADV